MPNGNVGILGSLGKARSIRPDSSLGLPIWLQKAMRDLMDLTGVQKKQGIEPSPSLIERALDFLPGLKEFGKEVKEDPLSLLDVPLGAIGVGSSSKSSQLGEVLGAAIPFSALKGKKLFHGTKSSFKQFDPSMADPGDLMNKPGMMHFAENPEYASQYAQGTAKHLRKEGTPQIRASELMGQGKALDLIDTFSTKDVNRLMKAGLDKESIRDLVATSATGRSQEFSNILGRDPTLLKRAGYDAVRYVDAGESVWALASPEKESLKALLSPTMTENIPSSMRMSSDVLKRVTKEKPVGRTKIRLEKKYTASGKSMPSKSNIEIEDVPGTASEKSKTIVDWLKNDVISQSEYDTLAYQLTSNWGKWAEPLY